MLIVGLTGGIGSGKTAASDAFAELGVPVIDTDVLARELVEPGQPAQEEIATNFGQSCLLPDGQLNRAALRQRIFANPGLRKRLETILHPRISELTRIRVAALNDPYCLVVVPLLVESNMLQMMDRVLVIDVPEDVQICRVQARDGTQDEEARRIVQAQASRAQRLEAADDVIENSGSFVDLRREVKALDTVYRRLAAAE